MKKEENQKLKVEFKSNAPDLEKFCRLLSLAIGEETLNQLRSEAIEGTNPKEFKREQCLTT